MMENMHIHTLQGNPKENLDLLLLADPDETMIDRYLSQSQIFVLAYQGQTACQAVVQPVDAQTLELKNLATAVRFQKRGLAGHMIRWLCENCPIQYRRMIVGTSRQGCSFYQRYGFRLFSVVPHFFTDHYSQPIYEQGELCVDLFYLERNCKEPWE